MKLADQMRLNGMQIKPTSSFLADLFELPASTMLNDHEGSRYPAEAAPSNEEVRKSIRDFARLMS